MFQQAGVDARDTVLAAQLELELELVEGSGPGDVVEFGVLEDAKGHGVEHRQCRIN